MDNLNMRVYKVVRPDGSWDFQFKTKDETEVASISTIEILVDHVMDTIRFFFKSSPRPLEIVRSSVSIDLCPYHDIDCNGIVPKLCMPLNEEETKAFFNALGKKW